MNDFTNALYPLHTESFTVDGRRLMIKLLKKQYPHIPIQMCLFHMKAIIRRYTTLRPKTKLGKALLILKSCLGIVSEKMFIRLLESIEWLYADFLIEKNIQGKYEHKWLRTVMRSIRYYLPYLYTYERLLLTNPDRRIPRTTWECDGYFRHVKDYFRMHGGMRQKNRNNFIIFLLEEHNRKLQKDI